MFTRSPAFGLSFEIMRFAVAKVLSGVVAVAVNVAVVEPAVEVRPIRSRAVSAIVARRKFGPRILVPLFFRLDPPVFLSATTIPFRTRTGMGPQRELHLAHWDYDLASAGSARDGYYDLRASRFSARAAVRESSRRAPRPRQRERAPCSTSARATRTPWPPRG